MSTYLKHVHEQTQNVFCWYSHSLCFDHLTHMGTIEVTNTQPSEDSRASGILKQWSHVGALIFHVHFVKSSICFWHI